MTPVWDEIRRDFPVLARYAYLNAAAASPSPRCVSEAVIVYLRAFEEGGDLHWDEWLARLEEIREKVARFINAEPDEIAFVTNTSTGMNLIADLLGDAGPVLTDELEFPTVTLPWIHRGIAANFVPAIEGILHPESFSVAFAPRAATLLLSHVQFSNGCRVDLEAFGAQKAHRHFVVCASQSLGALPVDVKAAGIDALTTSGHKWLCAGYGAGFAFVRREIQERYPPRTIGWLSVEDPYRFDNRQYRLLPSSRRFELGCPPFGPIFALGAAIDYLAGIGKEAIEERVLTLNAHLTRRLEEVGHAVLSPGGANRSGQTLVALPDPPAAVAFLKERGVLVTEKPEGIRISTHFFNDVEDIERCVSALVDSGQRSPEPDDDE